ncbi:MAG TPA: response regulator [Lysobacter sp.]|nr:response regulator [Lysobacter sp.]
MTSAHPRLLLVEDDPVSAAFMQDALAALPAAVVPVASAAGACTALDDGTFALWLIDAHLPDGDGATLLARLRALQPGVPALAHTAAREKALLDALIAAGFAEVLIKPLSAAELQGAVRRYLPALAAPTEATRMDGKLPVLDDAKAQRALGSAQHVSALRALFRAELPAARAAVDDAARNGDGDALRAVLHRLRASCGFVGAARLEAAVERLHAAPRDAIALRDFHDAAADTEAAFAAGSDRG